MYTAWTSCHTSLYIWHRVYCACSLFTRMVLTPLECTIRLCEHVHTHHALFNSFCVSIPIFMHICYMHSWCTSVYAHHLCTLVRSFTAWCISASPHMNSLTMPTMLMISIESILRHCHHHLWLAPLCDQYSVWLVLDYGEVGGFLMYWNI